MFAHDSKWRLYVVEANNEIIGFVSIQVNLETTVGEIGLNAVKPLYSGKGVGTKMYDFAIAQMKAAGMRVATVATGGDESHAPARRAYEKSGFEVQIPSAWYCRTLGKNLANTLKTTHKKRGLDSLTLAFYVGVMCT